MATVEKSIEVNVPIRKAYDQWTQFESFPQFMEGVKEVRQLDDTHLHWRAEIGGKEVEWDAEIGEQEPDRIVAWRSTSGRQNDGMVHFEPSSFAATPSGSTRGMFSVSPPPVMCANPFTSILARVASTGFM